MIEDLEFLPNEYIQDKIPEEAKRTIFDLQIKTNEGIFIVEMQKGAKPEYLPRVEFYSAIAYSSQPIKKGPHIKMKEYVNAKPVVTISILDEDSGKNIFDPDVPCISYHINTEQKTDKQYMKAFSYVFIDLKKFNDQEDIAEDMQDWLRLFKKQDLNYNYHNEQVKNAIKYINDIRDNNYEAYVRHLLTEQIQETEKRDARAEGKAEGEAKRTIEMIKNLLESNVDKEIIAKAAGLSPGQIEELSGNQKNLSSYASTMLGFDYDLLVTETSEDVQISGDTLTPSDNGEN